MNIEVKEEFESVFDEYRAKKFPNYTLKWKHTANFITIESSQFICEGILYNCSEWIKKPQHFIFTSDKIVACSISSPINNIETSLLKPRNNYYMYIKNPRLMKIVHEGLHGLRLISGGIKQDFLCTSKQDTQRWFDGLKTVCVLDNIENNYKLNEVIGSGTSAFVRIGKKLDTGQEYAIKSIPKTNYTEKKHSLVHSINQHRTT